MSVKTLVFMYRLLIGTLISLAILTGTGKYAMIVLTFLWLFERPIERLIVRKFKLQGDPNEH